MIKGEAVRTESLTIKQTKEMFAVMQTYYDNLQEGDFYSDLLKKHDVVLLRDERGAIHGFTTLAIYDVDPNTRLLFSGDTIVEKEYWSKNDLSQVWVKNAMKRAEEFDGTTYWLLLTKGYKTYKFLHTFFNAFAPRVDAETPLELQAIIDAFAKSQWGDKYQNGVLVAGKDYLKDDFAEISEDKLKDKNTAFFLKRNPNYKMGDELVCIAEMCESNLNRLGRKMLRV